MMKRLWIINGAILAGLLLFLRMQHVQEENRRDYCRIDMRTLAFGALQHIGDYDGRIYLRADQLEKQVAPYMQALEQGGCREHGPGGLRFALNPHLTGAHLKQVRSPKRTVLFFEADKDKMAFPHNGCTGVAFADGHVEFVTREQAKSLQWSL